MKQTDPKVSLCFPNYFQDRLWRKNRRPNKGSECIGTDLNRNWQFQWGGNTVL